MAKQLFVVTLTREILVVADDAFEAQEMAQDAEREGDLEEPAAHAVEMSFLPGGWEMTSIPWGDRDETDPDRTVGKWIEMGAAPQYTAMQERLAKKTAG